MFAQWDRARGSVHEERAQAFFSNALVHVDCVSARGLPASDVMKALLAVPLKRNAVHYGSLIAIYFNWMTEICTSPESGMISLLYLLVNIRHSSRA